MVTSLISVWPLLETLQMNKFTFIDLFAGIGGFHLALKNLGGECVLACEIDKHARETYTKNHEFLPHLACDYELFPDDIRLVQSTDVPAANILCAGFPCQPFSQAGFKNGFDDTRGTLFFEISRFINWSAPSAFFLENVPHLLKHDNGRTFDIIKDKIYDLGYRFYYKIIRASDFGLPQRRPRLIMVGFKNDYKRSFTFPEPVPLKLTMSDILGGECPKKIGYTLRVGGRGSKINDRRNWDSYLVDGKIKRLTPAHALKMQGFPADFKLPVSETQAMKQLGNSVAVPVIQAVGKQILEYLREN